MYRASRHAEDATEAVVELTADSPVFEQPSHITDVTLRPHQLTLVQRCLELERGRVPVPRAPSSTMRTQIGIIGDKVGSGKSFVLLTLAITDPSAQQEPHIVTYTYGNAHQVTVQRPDDSEYCKTTLLVVPHVLASQWATYCTVFFRAGCGVRYAVVHNKKSLEALTTLDEDGRDEAGNRLSEYDLVVVTSSHHNKLAALANSSDVRFRRVIFDEADVVCIPGCVRPVAAFTWFVTASFANLVYPRGLTRHDEVLQRWTTVASGVSGNAYVRGLFASLVGMPSAHMAALVVKNCDEFVKQSMRLPDFLERTVLCRSSVSLRVLDGLVSSNILDHLNAGDTDGALMCISASHKGSQESIIRTLIDKWERERQNLTVRLEMTDRMQYDTDADREEDKRRLGTKLQEVAQKILSIEERVRQADICNICYEEFTTTKTVLPCCSNAFCLGCITRWVQMKANCPLCKAATHPSSLLVVCGGYEEGARLMEPEVDTSGELHASNGKLVNLRNVLLDGAERADPSRRFLICSSYDVTLTNLSDTLAEAGVQSGQLKGNQYRIRSVVDRYKRPDGDLQALLINVHDFGSGLNLENTTDVILMHSLNKEIKKQVIGRAQRSGRTLPLRVWNLVHENERT